MCITTFIAQFVVTVIVEECDRLIQVTDALFDAGFGIVMMAEFGFIADAISATLNNPAWHISSLMTGLIVLYPLARRHRHVFLILYSVASVLKYP